MNKITFYALDLVRRFRDEDEGIALSEYLVLLGLLIGGVIVAVIAFGTNLSEAWNAWGDWIVALGENAPT